MISAFSRRRQIIWPALIATVTVAAVAAASPASARVAPLAARQADAAVVALAAQAPRLAATPGASAAMVPGKALSSQGVVVSTSGCARQAALLKAGQLRSYRCASASVSQPAARGAVSWPSQCSTGQGELTGWLAVDRRNACNHIEIDITVTEHPSEKVIGTADLHAVSMMSASTSSARWAHSTYLWLWSFTGVGAPEGADGSMFPSCSTASCLGENETWTPLSDGESWRGKADAVMGGLSSGKVDSNVAGFWEYTLFGADWGNSVTVRNYVALNRCDNATPGVKTAGCVFGYIPAVLGFSQSRVPAFVQHIYAAQVSGLPGRLSTSTYLTRLTDSTLSNKNGSKACPSSGLPKAPSGDNCDEYPFRSTYQGASTSGATQARSFSFCHMSDPQRTGSSGWSRCYIPATQNSSAGGSTGAFYSAQRMLAHDPFQIGYLS